MRLLSMQDEYINFHIISSYSVKQWVKVADKVNLWISTSNAEVLAMGKECAINRPIPIPDELDVESMRGKLFITDYNSFFEYNTFLSDKITTSTAEQMKGLSNYYSYNNEIPSYVRIVDSLEQIIKSKKEATYRFSFKQHIVFGWREVKKRTISLIMEICRDRQSETLVNRLPLKKNIKDNIIEKLQIYKGAKQTEEIMMQYMNRHSS